MKSNRYHYPSKRHQFSRCILAIFPIKNNRTTDVPRYFLDPRAFIRIQDREEKRKREKEIRVQRGDFWFLGVFFRAVHGFALVLSRVRERLAD